MQFIVMHVQLDGTCSAKTLTLHRSLVQTFQYLLIFGIIHCVDTLDACFFFCFLFFTKCVLVYSHVFLKHLTYI